jgi:hypothetical protein
MPKDVEPCSLCFTEVNGVKQAIPMPAGWTLVALPMTVMARFTALGRMDLYEGQSVPAGELLDLLLEGRHYPEALGAKIENPRLAVTGVRPAEDVCK